MVRRRETETDNGYCSSDNGISLKRLAAKSVNGFKTKVKHRVDQEVGDEPEVEVNEYQEPKIYKWDIVWRNVIVMVLYHISAVYGLYLACFYCQWKTVIWAYFLGHFSAISVTSGAHRLWAHKSYKAKWPLKVLLLIGNNLAAQNSVIEWVRDHRVHHKFTETDADPHNSNRGFFFSHMGWLMVRKHEDVKTKGVKVSVQDLCDDPMLVWQHKYYLRLVILFSFVIPTYVPVLFWNEHTMWSFHCCGMFRYVLSLHLTWCINSLCHLYGVRPYDKRIGPRQNRFFSFFALGEAWHNYHHKFPRDYRASEYPSYAFNMTKGFIEFFVWIGWAYDLTTASPDVVEKTKMRHGDGEW